MDLSRAHHGYAHQDVLTACAYASLLLTSISHTAVVSERKTRADDVFDDMALEGSVKVRCQIKGGTPRALALSDLTTRSISFRLDAVLAGLSHDVAEAGGYRLVVTYGAPDATLAPYVTPAPNHEALLDGLPTSRFALNVDAIWPSDSDPSPKWSVLKDSDRDVFVDFATRFVIETDCPVSSADPLSPGPLEQYLVDVLRDCVGAGHAPNQHRQPEDVLAQLLQLAYAARIQGARRTAREVLTATGLRTDFGRVEEELPIDESLVVRRTTEIGELEAALLSAPRVAVTGPPGAGKSWLLAQLDDALTTHGWVVATHYCFVDLADPIGALRGSSGAMFGSLIARLLDTDPTLATETVPRYAAGARELEEILRVGQSDNPARKIALIVDGLDHVDRRRDSGPEAAEDIVQELSSLQLPQGVALLVASQPGVHLDPLWDVGGALHSVRQWDDPEVVELVKRVGVPAALAASGLDSFADDVTDAIVHTAGGNPLYATYLARTASQIAGGGAELPPGVDIVEYLRSAPPFDAYYAWLLEGLGSDAGARHFAEVLSFLDFPVTAEELREIQPGFGHHVDGVLSRLGPVLVGDADIAGVRIYHESFQRHVLEAATEMNRAALLDPVIGWLESRGFFRDGRAFHSLLPLLVTAGRLDEAVALIDRNYVAQAAAECQPGDAAMANLASAAAAAAELQAWSSLARLVEVSRASDNLYHWRLNNDDELAEDFGRAYASLHGSLALRDRLLRDGRPTFRPRPGLVLCRLCDGDGVGAPWPEYLRALDRELETDNTDYGEDTVLQVARLTGELRIVGHERATGCAADMIAGKRTRGPHPLNIAYALGTMYGAASVQALADMVAQGPSRGWCWLALAHLSADENEARERAQRALGEGLSVDGVRMCLALGADPAEAELDDVDVDVMTAAVVESSAKDRERTLAAWLMRLDVVRSAGGDPLLFRIENLIPADSWYHRWLRFAVALRRNLSAATLVGDLQRLAENVQIFAGTPRVVDLYFLHDDIRDSFRRALRRMDNEDWCSALDALAGVSRETSSWLQGSRSGPLPIDALLELALETADTAAKAAKASELAAQLLAPGQVGAELYDTHARDQLLLVRTHVGAGRPDLANAAWEKACLYLAAYGFRKDVTVYEVLEPIEALGRADPFRARDAIKALQPLVEGMLAHTDGSETRQAIHEWIDLAAKIHPAGALAYLGHYDLHECPSFGDLDHALPVALTALHDVVPAASLTAGWVGSGSEGRRSPTSALAACEAAIGSECDWAPTAWWVIVGALSGDGPGTAPGATRAIAESAVRLGYNVPRLPEEPPDERYSSGSTSDGTATPDTPRPHFALDPSAKAFQIAYELRRWRSGDITAAPHEVAGAVAASLVSMHEDGRGEAAAGLIRRIARDTPTWAREPLFPQLAEALHGKAVDWLESMSLVYAYTRSRDGWRRFGGPGSQGGFLQALELHSEVAWRTLADEVADGVAQGGEYGLTVHMIELLVAGGRSEDAFEAWGQACAVIAARLPATDPRDTIDVQYESDADAPLAALVCAVIGRLNHCLVDERRAATAGLASLVAEVGPDLAAGVTQALREAPVSVMTHVLHLLANGEVEPHDVTRACEAELRDAARSPHAAVRSLARELLRRAGCEVDLAPPLTLPDAPTPARERTSALRRSMGAARLEYLEEAWPSFGRLAVAQLDQACRSADLAGQMQRAYRRLHDNRKDRQIRFWFADKEEVEVTLQRVASAARGALALSGDIDPAIEDALAAILADSDGLGYGVRFGLSRGPRPDHYETPSTTPSQVVEHELRHVAHGPFTGWVVLGHHENEVVVDDSYPHDVVARAESWSGLSFAEDAVDLGDNLPVGRGRSALWLRRLDDVMMGDRDPAMGGPVVGFDFERDLWGALDVFTPAPGVVLAADLVPGECLNGFVLVDTAGKPAVVARNWRHQLIGDELWDHEHCLVGQELLAREDVLTSVGASTPRDYVYVTKATTTSAGPMGTGAT